MAANPAADEVERMEFQLALRRRGISDQAVLRAMEEVPRENFVAPDFTQMARKRKQRERHVTEQLEVGPENRVLEIGTGSGYQAAVLARLAREVVTIERYRTLADSARERLKALGCHNVTIRLGDGMAGAPDLAPFDRIMVTAAAEEIPDALVAQLAEGGKMVLPVGPRHDAQYLIKLTKATGGELTREELIAVRFVPLLAGQAREL